MPVSVRETEPTQPLDQLRASVTLQVISLALQANVPFIWRGDSGIGKSEIVKALVRWIGWTIPGADGVDHDLLWTINLTSHEPTDITGIPTIRNGRTVFCPMEVFYQACEAEQGVLFFDEATDATGQHHSAVMQVVLESRAGYLLIPKGVRRVLAGNPADVNVSGHDIPAALANRLLHVDGRALAKTDWPKAMLSGFPLPSDIARLPGDWKKYIPDAMQDVADFIQTSERLLHVRPNPNTPAISRAWPSDRTWASLVVPMLSACRATEMPDAVLMSAIAGCVGDAAAREFVQYVGSRDLPKPAELLHKPSLIDTALLTGGDRVGRMLDTTVRYVATTCAPASSAIPASKEAAWDRMWMLLDRVYRSKKDIALTYARALLDAPGIRDKQTGKLAFSLPVQDMPKLHEALDVLGV